MTPFLIKRQRARGDVLLTTPVVKALHTKHPGRNIFYVTDFPEILHQNPLIAQTASMKWLARCQQSKFELKEFYQIVDLEIAYEKMPGVPLIDAFAQAAEVVIKPGERRLSIYPGDANAKTAEALMRGIERKESQPVILVAPGPGAWPGRNWSEQNWVWVCRYLLSLNLNVVLVGVISSEGTYRLPCTRDLRGKTTMLDLAALMKVAQGFIGIDSFPAHVAGAMSLPRIVLFGITTARLILCDAPNTVAIESAPDHPFTGARHCVERISSVRLGSPPQNPMDTISPEQVMEAAQKLFVK